jgi:ribulose-phosphate 3-epimerase
MAVICPTITAYDSHEYRRQMEQITPFAKRVHIDLMDGEFAPTKSLSLKQSWWPHELMADIHLMYQNPENCYEELIRLKPHMVIIHNEAQLHHMDFAARLHKEGIKTGLAVLRDTPIEYAYQIMHAFDHVLIFSGHLGYHGGKADLGLLDKVKKVRQHHPDAEIGWDGGINQQNARQLSEAGVDVLNTGGFIQKSDDPAGAYAKLKSVIESA